MTFSDNESKVVILAGGVGGAKIARGFSLLKGVKLTIIVNTGDDFEHLGVWISPDLDTVTYTLAGIASKSHGWGIDSDTRQMLSMLQLFGIETWFNLGDKDFATSVFRTQKMKEGWNLTRISQHISRSLAIIPDVIPMTNDIVSTFVSTDEGTYPFQEYFVHKSCSPKVTGFSFRGIDSAKPTKQVTKAIQDADLVLIAPSNPWVSIAPIINLNGIKGLLTGKRVVLVSPLISGKAVKGPAAKMFIEMGIEPSNLAIAEFYKDIVGCIFIDKQDQKDAPSIERMGIHCEITKTMMQNPDDEKRLAQEIMNLHNNGINT